MAFSTMPFIILRNGQLVPVVWSLRTQNVLDVVQIVGEDHVEDVLSDRVMEVILS